MTTFRFFTVYGPWGRPDMALFKFTRGIIEGKPIDVYNHGQMERDFTYIDDLVEAITRLIGLPPVGAGRSAARAEPGSRRRCCRRWRRSGSSISAAASRPA